MMFRYGDYVQDQITGYTGIVTACIDYYGYKQRQYIVEKLAYGGLVSSQIDENRLNIIEKGE